MYKSAQAGLLILAAALTLAACNKAPKDGTAAASSAAVVDLSSADPAKNPVEANKEPAASGFAP